MQFPQKVTLEQLIAEISEISAVWLDEKGQEVLLAIKESVAWLQALGHAPTQTELTEAFQSKRNFLDVCRLFLGSSQDVLANAVSEKLVEFGYSRATWNQIQRLASRESKLITRIMIALGLDAIISDDLKRAWTAEDILVERYRMGRGRAMMGQSRGRSLEDEIENGLKILMNGQPVPYHKKTNYTGLMSRHAKCDFAIPSKDQPKIVIEAKSYEATGSKQTDVLGDVRKIIEAKAPHTYFFMVTDGRGWHRRASDLEKLVAFHKIGQIDMIYTRTRLPEMNGVRLLWNGGPPGRV